MGPTTAALPHQTSPSPASGPAPANVPASGFVAEPFAPPSPYALVTEHSYADRSDETGEIAWERTWQLHPSQHPLALSSNVITFLDPADGSGFVWLRLASSALVRSWDRAPSLLLTCDAAQRWLATPGATALDYETHRVSFTGGLAGRTAALQAWQHARRPRDAARDGVFLSNTWGDRSRADKLCEAFVLAEIDRAAELGVEVVQLDDGWQRGRSRNTVESGGVWDGFWAADPDYWAPDPARFPRGLAPVAAHARARGLQLGLWYAPDFSAEAANWARDGDTLLALWREHGIAHFKLDAVKLLTPLAERRFRSFLNHLDQESRGDIRCDLDTTAEARLGFWGRPSTGPIFVQNRYTDWGTYHPHQTLRALWTLAHTVAPVRLRLELLNPHRATDRYAPDDPLRPAAYEPDTLFAIVMLASPLGWFENTGLPASFVAAIAPLVALWKGHREVLHRATVLPIGAPPDGHAWTGFLILDAQNRFLHALLFRENSRAQTHEFLLPDGTTLPAAVRVLHGDGEALGTDGGRQRLRVRIARPRAHLWLGAAS